MNTEIAIPASVADAPRTRRPYSWPQSAIAPSPNILPRRRKPKPNIRIIIFVEEVFAGELCAAKTGSAGMPTISCFSSMRKPTITPIISIVPPSIVKGTAALSVKCEAK
ncbi:hypothetical protein D3C73_1399180 [compost metagenome]